MLHRRAMDDAAFPASRRRPRPPALPRARRPRTGAALATIRPLAPPRQSHRAAAAVPRALTRPCRLACRLPVSQDQKLRRFLFPVGCLLLLWAACSRGDSRRAPFDLAVARRDSAGAFVG